MSEKIVLIDGHSILNRAFYGLPDLTNANGTHTNAMYGFLNILFKILDEEKPQYLAVAFDLKAPTFRHKMYDLYKGTRKPAPEEFREQVPLMKEVLKSMGIVTMELEGYEADDLLGTIAKRSEAEGLCVSVVSGDRDLLQLATDNIKIRIPKTKKGTTEVEDYNTKDVFDLYGVTPTEFIDMKALMGDTSDNIPGAPGIGPKTAGAIIAKYHSVDNVYEHIDEITPAKAKSSLSENEEQVRLSRRLAEIDTKVPYEFDYEKARIGNFFTKEAYELFKLYNFKSHLKRFENNSVSEAAGADISFTVIQDFADAEQAFDSVSKTKKAGMSILEDGQNLYCVALSDENKTVVVKMGGFITKEYLIGKIFDLCGCRNDLSTGYTGEGSIVAAFDVKEHMRMFPPFDSSRIVDVGIGAYILNPLLEKYDYELAAASYGVGMVPSRTEILGRDSLASANMIDFDKLARLAATEAYIAVHAWQEIEKQLEQTGQAKLYFDMDLPLMYVLGSMEREGVLVDGNELCRLSSMLGEKINYLEKRIYEQCGEEFNINSPKQLGVILFEKMGLPFAKKTKSGYSTSADILEKLAPDYPVIQDILDYRQVSKLKSTYADGLDAYIAADGRIHGRFNQTVTATGRLSSTEPNLQNIPIRMELGRAIRKAFIPKNGCVFVDADYSQIELRILSSMSGDEKLCSAYRTAQDIHAITASQVFNVPLSEVTKEMRSNAKAVNFGIIYGISSFGLSQDLSISKKEAGEYIKQYFATYPTIESFINGMVESAKKTGYAITMFGRKRPIPELKSSNFMQRSFGERIAMNSPIQGTAADIMKLAMLKIYNSLKSAGMEAKMIIQVHDEVLVETPEAELEKVKAIVSDAMTNAALLAVPLEVDCKSGADWLEAH